MPIFSDDEGKPIKGRYVGEAITRSLKGVGRGVGKVVTGELDEAREEYAKTKEDNDEIMKKAKKDRPEESKSSKRYGKSGADGKRD